jgi:hypothetical protein
VKVPAVPLNAKPLNVATPFTPALVAPAKTVPVPEVIVAVGLRFLGCGDTHTSLADTYGMSDSSAYRVIGIFLDAVDYNESCRAMQVRLPRGIDELNELAQRWRDVSTCPH